MAETGQKGSWIIALDQGTTSTRAILFDAAGSPHRTAQIELPQSYPKPGWVEHDPERIFADSLSVVNQVITDHGLAPQDITAIGITNQRETVVLWDRATGKSLHPAIVWQDRRTADRCQALKTQGHEAQIQAKTGLLLDPYFSGTKIAWLLDAVPGARDRAAKGELCAGTIDSWLVFRLTGGKSHVTDATNASRTMLFNIATSAWDAELSKILDVPLNLLPEVKDCAADFGATDPALTKAPIPIRGIAGDQQAAAIGQVCTETGMLKSTYGTGCFALLNTGTRLVGSSARLLTTVAFRLNGQTSYALEGSIFMAGAAVQWLRDGLKIISSAPEINGLAAKSDPETPVVVVPAFVGLGAPYWDPDARGAIYGLTRDSGPAEIARATLEAVAFQTRDLIDAMAADCLHAGLPAPQVVRVDGGMAVSDMTMQLVADRIGLTVERPKVTETTALGAALLAGLGAGLFNGLEEAAKRWQLDRRFAPDGDAGLRGRRYALWKEAVARTLSRRA